MFPCLNLSLSGKLNKSQLVNLTRRHWGEGPSASFRKFVEGIGALNPVVDLDWLGDVGDIMVEGRMILVDEYVAIPSTRRAREAQWDQLWSDYKRYVSEINIEFQTVMINISHYAIETDYLVLHFNLIHS